jgi:RNA polymerase sigma-70 factor, ECF subfamily
VLYLQMTTRLSDQVIIVEAGNFPRKRTVESTEIDWFEDTFHVNWARIYEMLFRILGDKAEAEDLALETFWRLYKNPPKSSENLVGWLYRVAANLGINSLRSRNRRNYYEASSDVGTQGELFPNPEDEIERLELLEKVQITLVRMKSISAQLLILRHSGLSYSELSQATGIRFSSIGKMLSRAEDEFKRLYE